MVWIDYEPNKDDISLFLVIFVIVLAFSWSVSGDTIPSFLRAGFWALLSVMFIKGMKKGKKDAKTKKESGREEAKDQHFNK